MKIENVDMRGPQYPFDKMKVGQSFRIAARLVPSVRYAAMVYANAQKKGAQPSFLVRKINKRFGRCGRVS